jgi:ferritin heavy chain
MESIDKAEPGDPKSSLARSPYLSEEVVEKLNEGIS